MELNSVNTIIFFRSKIFYFSNRYVFNGSLAGLSNSGAFLFRTKLHALCTMKEVQNYVRHTDYQFYQNIVTILLPDVLRPIPGKHQKPEHFSSEVTL